MVKRCVSCFIYSLILLFFSCKHNKQPCSLQSVSKKTNNIEVKVDPNVELMMIIGRLAGAVPYNFINQKAVQYINEIDTYFEHYKLEPVIESTKKNNLNYGSLPEFGMYMNKDISGFILDLNNKNFKIQGRNDIPAKKIGYYASNQYLDEIRDFKVKSNFDKFFENHRNLYEVMIEDIVTILIESEFNKWLETFYGYKIKENKCVYVSFLTGGGNFGLSIYNSKGTPIPHIVVYAGETKNMYLYLISHEFLHPCTLKMCEELYQNEKIQNIFNNLLFKNSSMYISHGYSSGFALLNETITQACANKFLERQLPESTMNLLVEKEIVEYQQFIYVPQIASYFDDYIINRKKYKTLNEFIPKLEEYIEDL